MLYGFDEPIQEHCLEPKRRKSKDNPYTLIIQDGRYLVSFKDGENIEREVELTKQQYLLFDEFELEDKRESNERERHYEQSEQTEASLCIRSERANESMEDVILDRIEKEDLRKAINLLPSVQQRRVAMYFFEEFSYEKIAAIEGCTKMPVKRSIDIALKKIKKFLE